MGQGNGRHHHIKAFSLWLAGGSVKPDTTWGNTDELGYSYQGRDFRLTDVHGRVIKGICA